jgi:gliding motility-associated-like protein
LENSSSGCTDIVSFTISVSILQAGDAPDMFQCENGFDLSVQDSAIRNGQEADVSYYLSESDAQNGTNPLTLPYNATEGTQTIYARLYDPDTGCYDITSFTLTFEILMANEVNAGGCIPVPGSNDIEVNLDEYAGEIIGDQQGVTVSYYATESDAISGENPISPEYMGPSTVLYSRVENAEGCYAVAPVNIEALSSPYLNELQEITVCNEGYGQGLYDLEEITQQAIGDQQGIIINIYLSLEDAMNETNALEIGDSQLISAPSELYLRADNENGCSSYVSVLINIENCPPVVPNAFTPNGDGINDEFTIHRLKTIYEDYTLRIYNRWGTLVYEGGDSDPFWDGKVDGAVITDDPSGTVYFYVLELNDGDHAPLKGTIYVKP